MSDDLEKRVAEKLGFRVDLYKRRIVSTSDAKDYAIDPHIEALWNALLAAERRNEELDNWLTAEVEKGQGQLALSLTEDGDIGLYNDRDDKLLGRGKTAFAAISASLLKAEGRL